MQAATIAKVFYNGSYPSHHWAVQRATFAEPKVVAVARFKDVEYTHYMNPTDKRGYWSIVRHTSANMSSTFNRLNTSQERIGLGLVSQLVAEAYTRIVPIAQIAVAGNFSHKFDSATGITQIGKEDEPSFLHAHIIGRGNPRGQYVDGVSLEGPQPGLNFDMMAKTPTEPGNESRVKWNEGEMEKVAVRLREEIEKIKSAYEELGITVITK